MASGGLGSHFRYGRNFVVEAKTTGRELGTGSYGTVEEVILILLSHVYKCNLRLVILHPLQFRLKSMGCCVLERRSMKFY